MPNPTTRPDANPADPSALSQPDAAVDLLADLEDRLGALRNWQSQSEAQAEQVRERSRKLEDRQNELDAQAQKLEQERAEHAQALDELKQDRAAADQRRAKLQEELEALDQAQAALDDRKRYLEAHAADVEAELDGKHRQLEAEERRRLGEIATQEAAAAELVADAEAELAKAQTRQEDLTQRLAEASEAQAKLDEARALHHERVAEADRRDRALDEREARLDEVAEKLEAERAKLDERAADLEAKAKELDRISDELDAELAKLDERQAELDAANTELKSQRELLESDQGAYRERKLDQDLRAEELESREAALAKSRQKLLDEAAAGKLDEQAAQERQAELDRQAEELEALRAAEAEATAQLDAARSEAATARESLAETQARLDGAQTLIAQRESELNELRSDLDSKADELARLRDQLDEAQTTLEEAQSYVPTDTPASDNKTDETEDSETPETVSLPAFTFGESLSDPPSSEDAASPGLEKLQALVEEREIEVADLRSQLETQARELAEVQSRAETLQHELDLAQAKLNEAATVSESADDVPAGEVEAELRAQIDGLTDTLAQRDEQLEDTKLDLDARTAEVQLLRDRVEELTAELEAASANAETAGPSADAIDDEEYTRRRDELDEQAAQIAADRQRVLERKAQLKQADEIIKQRREKIRQYITLAKEQAAAQGVDPSAAAVPTSIGASDAARLAGLDKDRAALAEVKQFLEQSEAAMVQRWATNKTGSLVTSTVIAVILAVGFSFFVGSQLATPVYRATMALEVEPEGDAAELPPGAWLTDYKRTLLSEPVLAEALNQMDQRNVRVAGTTAQLEEHLRENLSATGAPARIELAYFADDTALTGAVLEAFGRAVMVHHMAEDRKAGRLTDTARVLQPAVAESSPVQDERLKFALATFAAILAAAALFALPLRLLYGRSQRVLHENMMPGLAMLDETANPPSATDATAEPNADDEEGFDHGPTITNDGPPAGFARIPSNVDDEEQDTRDHEDEDEQPEQIFRF